MEQFEYGGRVFTIKSWQDGERLVAAGYEGERQVTLTYSCDFMTAADLRHYMGESANNALRESVREEISTRLANGVEV